MESKNKFLVIVESPAKAKTISKFLDESYLVRPTMGHIIDLPEKKMGVDIKNNFHPTYTVIPGKKKILEQLKKESQHKEKIYLATDPDREGEAIGWHIKNELSTKNKKEFLRVIFHEITKNALREAFSRPSSLNLDKVNAQITRRILDRIVGYLLSPLLWKKVTHGLSAGRVQSVALRLIVERENEIQKFSPQEYWEIEAELASIFNKDMAFIAKLEKVDNKRIKIKNKSEADEIAQELQKEKFVVVDIQEKEKKKSPPPPFITSSLQQEAFNKLGFSSSKTMLIAQQLYEGISLGEEGPVGLITYMRTDSYRISEPALKMAREFILREFGNDYLPLKPPIYKVSRLAQEAHEAIRPTSVYRRPENIKKYLTTAQYLLYELIYKRFLSSQMSPMLYLHRLIYIKAGKYGFVSTEVKPLFLGFSILSPPEKRKSLPPLKISQELICLRIIPSQHFTKPPPRFSEGSLVKVLEEKGIGRPSTYAPIIQTIIKRNYVKKLKGYLHPTDLGIKTNELLVKYFPQIMDVEFTAKMEEKLDLIEEGRINWVKVLDDFYQPLKKSLDYALIEIKKEATPTDKLCPRCERPMVIRWSRHGRFLSCSGFPACRFSMGLPTGIRCPRLNCKGELIQRHSKKGKIFYGCSNYPKCDYITKTLPSKS